MTPVTDPALLAQLNGSSGPKPVTDPALLAQLNGPQGFVANALDFAKSIPGGVVRGAKAALDFGAQVDSDNPDTGFDPLKAPIERAVAAANKALPTPQGRAGRVGEAIGEGLGNPLSYIGPGGALLKVGGSVLSSAGGEMAGQAAEGTPYEIPARLAGGLAGGAAAVKTMGARPLAAATPTLPELKSAANSQYQAARNADLVLHPTGPASWAAETERELTNGPKYAFTGGETGTAPKTMEALAGVQKIPESSPGVRPIATGADLDKLRIQLNNIAGETHEFKPTPDAKAAMVAKQRLAAYTENIPEDHVLAGDAKAYGSQTKLANANNAAQHRLRDFEQKITNATDASEGSIAAKIDNQIKSKLRNGYLTNEKKQRGLVPDEVAAIRDTNRGSTAERVLQQFGRLAPEGPMNLALHIGTLGAGAALTGGASIPIQIAGALAASAAKHTAKSMTKSNARRVAEMLAQRSPVYKERAALTSLYNEMHPTKPSNITAMARALLAH